MKKYLSHRIGMPFLACILGIICCTQINAQTVKQAEHKKIRVGFFPITGYLEKDHNGNYFGFGHEYLLKIADYTSWEYEYVPGSWEECLEMLKTGEIDLLGALHKTPERKAYYDYSDYQTGMNHGALYVSSDNPVTYENFDVFNTYTIGLIKGYAHNERFKEYAKANNFSPKYKEFYTTNELTEALEKGKVDAIINNSSRKAVDERIVAKFDSAPFWFATTKGNKEVLFQLNKALAQLNLDDPYYEVKLHEKYYRTDKSQDVAFSADEQNFIKQNVLRIGGNNDWSPIEYYNEREKILKGITVDIFNHIAKKAGLLTIQYGTDDIFDTIRQLQEQNIAIMLSFSSDTATAAKYGLKLSTPYLHVNTAVLGKKNVDKNAVIALPAGRPEIIQYVRENYSSYKIITCSTQKECIETVRNGNADRFFDIIYRSDEFLKDPKNRDFEIKFTTDYVYDICFAFAKNADPLLVQIINKTILSLSSNEINEIIFAHTISKERKIYVTDFASEYAPALSTGALICMFIFILIGYNYTKKIRTLAYTDKLTKIPNQEKFYNNVTAVLRESKKIKYALIVFDIDKFKWINDFFGFDAGNTMLCHIAHILKKDTIAYEQYARIGGDEFAMLLEYTTDAALLARLERIIDRIKAIDDDALRNYNLRFTFGIYVKPPVKVKVQALVDRTLMALMTVKPNIEKTFAFYDETIRAQIARKKEIENKMFPALLDGEFVPYFQGKYDIQTSRLVGAEALVRWATADGIINPIDFVPLFEENGFIREVDIYMLTQVCILLHKWLQEGIAVVPISVNISRLHLYHADFIETLIDIVEQYKIPRNLIEIELTESAAFENMTVLLLLMKKLKNAGFSLAMDDFGTGYSSLNLLKDIPFDVLKLDKDFFKKSDELERGEVVVSSVIQMAKNLHIKTVSEGVETEQQVAFLKQTGCDVAQGFFFAHPIPAIDFQHSLEKENKLEIMKSAVISQ